MKVARTFVDYLFQKMNSLDNTLNSLRKNGFRITKTRKSVLSYFHTYEKPLAPLAVLELLAEDGINVNKTTVYREIDFLLIQKIIKKVRIDHISDVFELSQRPHHHHAVCTGCGSIEDLTFKSEQKLLKEAQNQTSLKIHDHALEFYGLCQQCL